MRIPRVPGIDITNRGDAPAGGPSLLDSTLARNYELSPVLARNNPRRMRWFGFTLPLLNRPEQVPPVPIGALPSGVDPIRARVAPRYPLFLFKPVSTFNGPMPLKRINRPQRAPYYVPSRQYNRGDMGFLLEDGSDGG